MGGGGESLEPEMVEGYPGRRSPRKGVWNGSCREGEEGRLADWGCCG